MRLHSLDSLRLPADFVRPPSFDSPRSDPRAPLGHARSLARRSAGALHASPPRAALLVALVASLIAPIGATQARAAESLGYVFATDFSTGTLNTVALDGRAIAQDVAAGICPDARLRWHDGRLYVINRLGCDNILVLDGLMLGFVRQFSVGNGTNPSDILILSPTKAYVPRYDAGSLLIVNPETGATTGQISLASFGDADGIPEMDRIVRVGNRVFVSIQRLDRNAGFQPTDHSAVIVIDPTTDSVIDADAGTPGVQGILLTGKNPVTSFAFDHSSQRLLIGCTGFYGVSDGGIEWVNPATLASEGYAITGAALGGDIGDIVWNGPGHSYAIVTDPVSFDARLVSWNSVTGATTGTLFAPGGFSLADAELNDRDELYVCDNAFGAPGLFVFSTANDGMLAGPLDTGLPPNQITFDQGSNVAGVGEGSATATAAVRLSPPSPNPARRETRFAFELESPGYLRLEAFDVAGRSVRLISHQRWSAGPNHVRWDLTGASGARVRPGIYQVRATFDRDIVKKSDDRSSVVRIAVLD
jgi:hypothetical protein